MMDDRDMLLDRTCPLRGRVAVLVMTLPPVALVLTLFLAGWNRTREQTILLAILGVCFSVPAIQEFQERVQVFRLRIRKRYLGLWWERQLPSKIRFEPAEDLNPYGAIARAWLKAPPSIAIIDSATRRQVSLIGFDLLAGMTDAEYNLMLRQLNRSVQQGHAADGRRDGPESSAARG
jgi:hypothetical protein